MVKARRSRAKPANPAERELALRIVVVAPPPGVLFCVQGRLGEFLEPTRSTGADIRFDTSVRVSGEVARGVPRFLGRVAQGSPTERFLYVCSGTCAGDVNTPWTRRAKIPLHVISAALLAKVAEHGRLEARIDGKAKDGGPACATVPILGGGWRSVR